MQPEKSINRRQEVPGLRLNIFGHQSSNMNRNEKYNDGQVGSSSSHGHTKETHNERVDVQRNIRSSAGVASVQENSRRPSKLSVLAKGKDDVALDTDDCSTVVAGGVAPTEYKVPSGNTGGRYYGSRVCSSCTYHNEENATVCEFCSKILNPLNPVDVPRVGERFKQHSSAFNQHRKQFHMRLSGAAKTRSSSSDNTVSENIDKGIGGDRENWSCRCCTFLNPTDHKICAMCGRTREVAQPENRVCRSCPYQNKEDARVCEVCHRTLHLDKPETFV